MYLLVCISRLAKECPQRPGSKCQFIPQDAIRHASFEICANYGLKTKTDNSHVVAVRKIVLNEILPAITVHFDFVARLVFNSIVYARTKVFFDAVTPTI